MSMINLFKEIVSDIIKWTFILIGISFILSIINLVLRFDITDNTLPFLLIFSHSMSDFGFLLGSIMMGIGLIIAFFKRPTSSNIQKTENLQYEPKYQSKDFGSKKLEQSSTPILTSSSSTFSKRELTYICSGLLAIIIAILIYFSYLILFALSYG